MWIVLCIVAFVAAVMLYRARVWPWRRRDDISLAEHERRMRAAEADWDESGFYRVQNIAELESQLAAMRKPLTEEGAADIARGIAGRVDGIFLQQFPSYEARTRAVQAVVAEEIKRVAGISVHGDFPLEMWITKNFSGHGVAVRRKEDPAIPGEPFISMATAKELTRRAVLEFAGKPVDTRGNGGEEG